MFAVVLGQLYRLLSPEQVKRGYHCPPVRQPYWNTVQLSGFPDDILLDMIDSAYDTVLHSFSKKKQREMLENEDSILWYIADELLMLYF